MNPDCLTERDLILQHYGEAAAHPDAAAHLAACAGCRTRADRLAADLARIPAHADPDPAVATRIAARVGERLQQRRGRRTIPLLGGMAAALLAVVVTYTTWSTQPAVELLNRPAVQPMATLDLDEAVPDIEFLEDLELISNLELLKKIEGV